MSYTKSEMQAYTIATMMKPEQIIIVGTGLPLVGATLAKKCFEPSLTLMVESGLMDFDPVEIPRSVSDLRTMAHCAVQCSPYRYLGFQANALIHDNQNLIGFIGGAAIDPYGNVASTSLGDYHKPKVRFPGSGGANGIASFCNTIILMKHDKRKFIEDVGYITSPGWIDGPDGRKRCGLPTNRGPMCVVTDLGVLRFDDATKRMYLSGYYPFTTPEEIQANTSFALDISRAEVLPEPDANILRVLREEIDPGKIFLD